MKLYAEMEETVLEDFLQFRKEQKKRNADKKRLQELAQKVLWAIEIVDGSVHIIDPDHAEELIEMANEYI